MNGLKVLGHPLHPAIVHFPVASWTAAVVTDAIYLGAHTMIFWRVSEWLLVVGCVAALGAMAAGLADLTTLPTGSPAQRKALAHLAVMSVAWTLFLIDLLIRFTAGLDPPALVAWAGLALSILGFLSVLVGAYFGAQLVYDFGVGQTGRGAPGQPAG